MKVFRIIQVTYGAFTFVWLTASLFHGGFNPSVEINSAFLLVMFMLLGIDDWYENRKKYAALYFFLALVHMLMIV